MIAIHESPWIKIISFPRETSGEIFVNLRLCSIENIFVLHMKKYK